MKLSMYSIYDTIAQVFHKPFTEINDATAIRAFKQSIQENPNKNDYVLYHLGEYFDHSGSLVPVDNPNKIYTGFDVENNIVELPTSLQTQAE